MVASTGTNPRGFYDIQCPWEHEHSGEVDHGTGYQPGSPGTFKCLHGHCLERKTKQLKEWIKEQDPDAILERSMADVAAGLAAVMSAQTAPGVASVLAGLAEAQRAFRLEQEAKEQQRNWNRKHALTYDAFLAYLPEHEYIHRKTGALWPGASINAILRPVPTGIEDETIKASVWLDQNRAVHQMTWAPGLPEVIEGRGIMEGGWFDSPGLRCYNQFKPSDIKFGDATKAGPWLDLIRFNYPDDADHIIKYFAHRVQRPEVKIDHTLVILGDPGIGKETMIEPLVRAVGTWNFKEIGPHNLLEPFNPYVKAVVLRINEAKDMGEINRYQLYERCKTLTAAPPNALMCNEKNRPQHQVLNVCGVLITSNHKLDCLYLPPDDRRHYVACSERKVEDFEPGHWNKIANWYEKGGFEHVAAYLAEYDLSGFDPKAPPSKTRAFWNIADANQAPEDAELADVLDRLGRPAVVTIDAMISSNSYSELSVWLKERKNRRVIPHRMEKCGYTPTRNDTSADGLWKINKRRQVVYGRSDVAFRDRVAAIRDLLQE